ncbi:MAG TPA: hypothetical protein PKL04_09815 [Methanofastidiosum sp.]|nr:hypothetical protein [Methanofastidiosum sp.]
MAAKIKLTAKISIEAIKSIKKVFVTVNIEIMDKKIIMKINVLTEEYDTYNSDAS